MSNTGKPWNIREFIEIPDQSEQYRDVDEQKHECARDRDGAGSDRALLGSFCRDADKSYELQLRIVQLIPLTNLTVKLAVTNIVPDTSST
jgi:hypothetical protein